MAKADIWMPFYVADYLADTMHLTAAEHGGYLMLICHYWKTGPIPNDDERLATITKLGDAWSNARSILLAFFEHCDGMLVHRRIDQEKADAIDNKTRKQAKAKDAAAKRWSKHASSNAQSNAQAMPDRCPSPSPSPTSIKPKSKADSATATRLPADWSPSFADMEFCSDNRPDLRIDGIAAQFRDYWIAQPGAKGRKTDWSATWRNWVRNQNAQPNARGSPQSYESARDKARRETMEKLTGRSKDDGTIELDGRAIGLG